jgi:hypothetical protein
MKFIIKVVKKALGMILGIITGAVAAQAWHWITIHI